VSAIIKKEASNLINNPCEMAIPKKLVAPFIMGSGNKLFNDCAKI
jgi:hypothetical protein